MSRIKTRAGSTILSHLLILVFSLLLLPIPAKSDIDELYQEALNSYNDESWIKADSLASLALMEIDSIEATDWFYSGDQKPFMAYFSGDLIYLAMNNEDQDPQTGRVEIYDPSKDDLVKVFDFAPWTILGSVHSENYTATILSRIGYLGFRISYFRKGNPDDENTIFLHGYEDINVDRKTEHDTVEMYLKGPDGWVLAICDFETRIVDIIHEYENVESGKLATRLYKIAKDSSVWKFSDGKNVYSLTSGSQKEELVLKTPFEINKHDMFKTDRIAAIRNDTLYLFNTDDGISYRKQIIHLPFPISVSEKYASWDIDDSNKLLAFANEDSLWLFRIEEDKAIQAYQSESLLGGTFVLSYNTFWNGDTLIHYGNKGMRAIQDFKVIHTLDSKDFYTLHCQKKKTFYVYRPPGEFSAFSLSELEKLWETKYAISESRIYDKLCANYLYINHIDGTSIIDSQTGKEVVRSRIPATMSQDISLDEKRVLLNGNNFVGMYDISISRYRKNQLLALSAGCKLAQDDISEAVSAARQAMALGTTLPDELAEEILNIFRNLNLEKEAIRLIGKMTLNTDENIWEKMFVDAGGDFIIRPNLYDFFATHATKKGVFAFQLNLNPSFNPSIISKGNKIKTFWFNRPDFDKHEESMSLVGNSSMDNELVLFKYSLDEANQKLLWNPMLFKESGKLEDLGLLYESKLEGDNNYLYYPGWSFIPAFSNHVGDRAVINFEVANPIHGKYQKIYQKFTMGLDLSGNGDNWLDTTLVDPVRIGEKYYGHELYGHLCSSIIVGGQADSIGIIQGDVVYSLGDYEVSNTVHIDKIKGLYPLRTPLDIGVIRSDDTLHFTAFSGLIGFMSMSSYKLVEINPESGKHLDTIDIPPGHMIIGANTSGELVYKFEDTLLFFDPLKEKAKKLFIKDFSDYNRSLQTPIGGDIVLMIDYKTNEYLALDIASTADDSNRVLWKQLYRNIYRIDNRIQLCTSDDKETLPVLLNDGTLILLDIATGATLSREVLPYRNFGYSPQISNGVFYGVVANTIFGWNLDYYNPPFPWKNVGYGALAFVPLVFMFLLFYKIRIAALKQKQAKELEQERISQELETAAAIQKRMVPAPDQLPVIERFLSYGHNFPCKEVGGDYLDIIPISEGRYGFVICDVSSKGLPAALLVSSLQATLHSLLLGNLNLVEIAERTNRILFHNTSSEQYATAFIGIIDTVNCTIETVNAGHNAPMLLKMSGKIEKLDAGGIVLGAFDDSKYSSQKVELEPSDSIYLFTDGVSEAFAPDGEEFGDERLEKLVISKAGKSPREMLLEIEHTIRDWTNHSNSGNGFAHDDFTQMAIQRVD
ncbi:MAG: PP2C family protein-serine/threonine phosphatase [Candidatus Electryonea clarkiae]|nr:PP2C family protein-serine/threonine phosphatase [Candidatus Electryonea clarkiae]MDP8285075.1 PP2C family protein-serine/threonine phosphatase [Candidatus Electryonea clarkiae]